MARRPANNSWVYDVSLLCRSWSSRSKLHFDFKIRCGSKTSPAPFPYLKLDFHKKKKSILTLRPRAKGALPMSANAASTASSPSPSSSSDGAPWYGPSIWCSCSGMKFAAIAAATSATGAANRAECAYSVLPTSTINPISVSSAPTNIPGQNGLNGCAAVDAGDEQGCPGVDYCNCNEVYVDFLYATVSGSASRNCDYSIQPTANNCPVNTAVLPASSSSSGTGCTSPCCTEASDCKGTCARGWVCSPAGSGQSTG